MVFLIEHKYKTVLFFLIVFKLTSQIRSDDNLVAGVESCNKGGNDVPLKAEKVNAQENDAGLSSCEDDKDSVKVEKTEQERKTEIKSEHENGEESDPQCHSSNEKQPEKQEGNDQQANVQDDKSEDAKPDASNNDAAESKKQVQKNDANHKTDLNDVNAYSGDGEDEQLAKREASFANSDFLGLPRDANYFFDDLEPFINNYTDTRVGRAAPIRDAKSQKTRVANVKGKDSVDEDLEEDDEEDLNEEEEKLNEDDYEDDDEADSDCTPTTGCSSPTTCATTTPKCTTTPACTTESKTTKCPKLCAKAVKRTTFPPRQSGCCLEEKKKLKGGKRRFHSQNH